MTTKHKRLTLALAVTLAAGMLMGAFTPVSALFGKTKAPAAVATFAKTEEPGSTMTFSSEDFTSRATGGELSGIIIDKLPDPEAGTLVFSGMPLASGNVIAIENVGAMAFSPAGTGGVYTTFDFIPIFTKTGAAEASVTVNLNLTSETGAIPIALDGDFTTYCDLKLTGKLRSMDFGVGGVTYAVQSNPQKGQVTISGDKFYYTPTVDKNTTDAFTFVAQDKYGNRSEPATVTIKLLRRDSQVSIFYTDMEDSPAHFAAVRLAELGVFSGESFGSASFLYPETPVTRAQFVSLVATAIDMALPTSAVTTGMGDNESIPAWAQPHIAAALNQGIVTGEKTLSGNRIFRAEDTITKAEAATIINRALGLSNDGRAVSYDDTANIPTWAYQAVVNTVSAGIVPLDGNSANPYSPVTREQAAEMLYQTISYLESKQGGGFFNIFK